MQVFELTGVAANSDFQARVRYLMVKAAIAKLNAQSPTSGDILLGQKILNGSANVGAWALACVTNSTIAAGAHSANGSTIVDSDLEFTVNSLWSAFAV